MTTATLTEMTTAELLARDAKIGNYLDKAYTPDGKVAYVDGELVNVAQHYLAERRAIRAELERRKNVEIDRTADAANSLLASHGYFTYE